MLVRELMSKGVDGAGPECRASEAARRMKRHNVGMLPVLDRKRVVGVVTDRDIVVRIVAEGLSAETTALGAIMTSPPVCCRADDDLLSAAKLMEEKKVRRMPVTNERGTLLGILSLDDFGKRIHGQDVAGEVLEAVAARRR